MGDWHSRKIFFVTILFCVIFLCACGRATAHVQLLVEDQVPADIVSGIQESLSLTQRLFEDKYALSLSRMVTVKVVPDEREYLKALLEIQKLPPLVAEARSRQTVANSRGDSIVINAEKLSNPRLRYFVPAHELTHQYQSQLSGQTSEDIMWLHEGFANVIGVTVTQMSGRSKIEADRRISLLRLKKEPVRPRLLQLSSRQSWEDASREFGLTKAYISAETAVFFLMDVYGTKKITTYFQELRNGEPREAFNKVFNLSVTQFEEQYENHLEKEFNKISRLEPAI